MRIKAILVDDEVHILNNLAKVIPWDEIGIDVISLARNGVEALVAIKRHKPDLILTDIRMPVMDGMALLKEIRKFSLESEILLLTGYQQFEYAQTAIRYGVQEYICKPINYFELEDTVREVAQAIRAKKKAQSKEQQYDRIVYLATENYLLNGLLGQSSEDSHPLWVDGEDGEKEATYTLHVIDAGDYTYVSMNWTEAERKEWNMRVRRKMKQAFGLLAPEQAILQIREGEWCLLTSANEADRITANLVSDILAILQIEFAKDSKIKFRATYGGNPCKVSELASQYKQLQLQLMYTQSEDNVIELKFDASETAKKEVSDVSSNWEWIEDVGKGLRNANGELLGQVIEDMKKSLPLLSQDSISQTEKLLHYVLILLLREMREQNMLAREQEEQVWLQLQEDIHLKELKSLVIALLEQAKSSLSTKKNSELLMHAAESYIQQQLDKDFGIDDISQYLGISCSYFCLLFKNHFGETFVEHVTRKRMEEAKTLLATSDKSVTQIGMQVGYHERRYFTKVFQKYTGKTPSEYRLKASGDSY